MNYEKIWEKVLNTNEKIEHEFSIGDGYIKFNLIVCGIICLVLPIFVLIIYDFLTFIISLGFCLLVFALVYLYLAFYLRAANAFAFTDYRVLIHRGWLSTHAISVDYSKITDIHIREPFYDRVMTHTGNIAIVTAGRTSDQIVLHHINAPYEVKKTLDLLKDKK